jgi:hypothetical protein
MKKSFGRLAVIIVALIATAGVARAYTGAIFTTTSGGTSVNANIYDFKADVYLNGGPQNKNSAGLPDGFYFFQVTNPSGSVLLSSDDAVCRQLQVVGGVVAGPAASASYPSGCLHAPGTFNPANGSTPVQLIPFLDTPNAGGEYKVWLIAQTAGTTISGTDSKVIFFSNPDSKTDNFKVLEEDSCEPNCPLPQGSIITGVKFYDTNGNGVQDSGEPGIPGWKIVLFNQNDASDITDTTTGSNPAGGYSFLNIAGGTYGVCEILPDQAPPWVPTTVTSHTGIVVPPDSTSGNDFGNVCLGAGGGLTLGFWSNKNGAAKINDGGSATPELTLLSNLCLVNGNGSAFDPANVGALQKWLLGANAVNMANMLSAQLAAMALNVEGGYVGGGSVVYAPGCGNTGANNDFISINDLMAAANAALCADGNTPSGDPHRAPQECLKNALDSANNNQNFILPPVNGQIPCAVNYTGNPQTCAPFYSTP